MVSTVFCSAAWIRITVLGKSKYIILCNIYISPSGNPDIALSLDDYLEQIQQYLRDHSMDKAVHGWIMAGDFNASHARWGAPDPIRSDTRYKRGEDCIDWIDANRFQVLGSGQATRWYYRKNKHSRSRTIANSWIDLSLCRGFKPGEVSQWIVQRPQGPDHFPIYIEIGAMKINKLRGYYDNSYFWKFKGEEEELNWDIFRDNISDLWIKLKERFLELKAALDNGNAEYDKQSMLNYMASEVITMYHNTAYSVFGIAQREETWKKWTSKAARRASIKYHRYWRKMKKKSRIKANHWRKLKALKKDRNRLMKHYKRQWLESKFDEYDLSSKEGWQIAAEVRDLHETSGKPVPDIVDADTGEVIADTPGDKVSCLLDWYHRFDAEPPIPSNIGYESPEPVLDPITPILKNDLVHTELELDPPRHFNKIYNPANHLDDSILCPDYSSLDNKYTKWMNNLSLIHI